MGREVGPSGSILDQRKCNRGEKQRWRGDFDEEEEEEEATATKAKKKCKV